MSSPIAGFDQAIRVAKRGGESYLIKVAQINKILFLKAQHLDLDDWRKIRGKKYWELSDQMKDCLTKKRFLLSRIVAYEKQLKISQQLIR